MKNIQWMFRTSKLQIKYQKRMFTFLCKLSIQLSCEMDTMHSQSIQGFVQITLQILGLYHDGGYIFLTFSNNWYRSSNTNAMCQVTTLCWCWCPCWRVFFYSLFFYVGFCEQLFICLSFSFSSHGVVIFFFFDFPLVVMLLQIR